MKLIRIKNLLQYLCCTAIFVSVLASPPVSVIANVRGKKFEITAETVSEVIAQVEGFSGLDADKQSVLFRGKVLSPTDSLHEIGISNGDVLNVLKGRKIKPPTIPRALKPKQASSSSNIPTTNPFESAMNQEQIQEELRKIDPAQLQKAMKAMETLLDSPEMDSFFNDDEKIEQSRLDMLNNLDKFQNAPGASAEMAMRMKEMAEDPKKWKDAMKGARAQIATLRQQRAAAAASKARQQPQQLQPPTGSKKSIQQRKTNAARKSMAKKEADDDIDK